MDEQLKARLIGGAVLVVLVVLVVPELLSGRKAAAPDSTEVGGTRGTRAYTIDLGGGSPVEVTSEPVLAQPGPEAKPQTAEQPPPDATDARAGPATTSGPVVKQPPAIAAAPVTRAVAPEVRPEVGPATAPTEAPAKTAAPARKGGWAVQVGAFGSAGAASKLVEELDAAGFAAYEAPVTRAGKTLHRVRVGPEAERAAADRLAARLKARGLPATVVAND